MEIAYAAHRQIIHVDMFDECTGTVVPCFYTVDRRQSTGHQRFFYPRSIKPYRSSAATSVETLLDEFRSRVDTQALLPEHFCHNVEAKRNARIPNHTQRFWVRTPAVYIGTLRSFEQARFDGAPVVCGADRSDSAIPLDVYVSSTSTFKPMWYIPRTSWRRDNDDDSTTDPIIKSAVLVEHGHDSTTVGTDVHHAVDDGLLDAAVVRFQCPVGMTFREISGLYPCSGRLAVWDDLLDPVFPPEKPRTFDGLLERTAISVRALEVALGVVDSAPVPQHLHAKVKIPLSVTMPASTASTPVTHKAWYFPPVVSEQGRRVGSVVAESSLINERGDISHWMWDLHDNRPFQLFLADTQGMARPIFHGVLEHVVFHIRCSALGSMCMDRFTHDSSRCRDSLSMHKIITVGTRVKVRGCDGDRVVRQTCKRRGFRVRGDDEWRPNDAIVHVYNQRAAITTLSDTIRRGKVTPQFFPIHAGVPVVDTAAGVREFNVGDQVEVHVNGRTDQYTRSWGYNRYWLHNDGYTNTTAAEGTVVRYDERTGVYDVYFPTCGVSGRVGRPPRRSVRCARRTLQDATYQFHPRDLTRVFRTTKTIHVGVKGHDAGRTRKFHGMRRVFLAGAYGAIISPAKNSRLGFEVNYTFTNQPSGLTEQQVGCLFACNHGTLGVQGTHHGRDPAHVVNIFNRFIQEGGLIDASTSAWSNVLDPARGRRKRVVVFYLMEIPRTYGQTDYNGVPLPTTWETKEPTPGVNTKGIPHAFRYESLGRHNISSKKQWREKTMQKTLPMTPAAPVCKARHVCILCGRVPLGNYHGTDEQLSKKRRLNCNCVWVPQGGEDGEATATNVGTCRRFAMIPGLL